MFMQSWIQYWILKNDAAEKAKTLFSTFNVLSLDNTVFDAQCVCIDVLL